MNAPLKHEKDADAPFASAAQLIPPKHLAGLLTMSLATLYRKLALGQIGPEPIKFGKGCVRFRSHEIGDWISAGCPDRQTWQALRANATQE